MELEQILSIVTPILSGAFGIIASAVFLIRRIRRLISTSKEAIHDHGKMQSEMKETKAELRETKKAMVELNQKIAFLVEEAKARTRNEEQQQN